MAFILTLLLPLSLAGGSAYTFYHAQFAAQNLDTYTDTTKKAAKYLDTAEEQLWMTRKTMASALATSGLTFVTSLWIFISDIRQQHLSNTRGAVLAYAANLVCCMTTAQYMKGYFKGTARAPPLMPGTKEYNAAMRSVEVVMPNLLYLAGGWLATAVVALIS